MSAILGKGLSLKGCGVVEARCDIIDGAVPDVPFFLHVCNMCSACACMCVVCVCVVCVCVHACV